jgi:hypothetical protein
MNDDTKADANEEWFKRQLIGRAENGEAEAGRQILRSIAVSIDAGQFDPILFPFLAKCLWLIIDGAPPDKALCIEEEKSKGGTPRVYDPDELAAVDILLRDYAKPEFSPEQAIAWIEEHIGADRRMVQRLRAKYDARYNQEAPRLMEALDKETLLHRSGSLRPIVAQTLSDAE